MPVQPIPKGYHSATPYLIINGAGAAIEFYKKAFGATELMRFPMGDKIGHAEIKIGDSTSLPSGRFSIVAPMRMLRTLNFKPRRSCWLPRPDIPKSFEPFSNTKRMFMHVPA